MRKTLVAGLLGALALLVLPWQAEAGGPTSVLITDPGSGKAAALYYESAAYDQLDELLQQGAPAAEPQGQLGSSSYNVTWMIHDVVPWRLQVVYPRAAGGPLVSTRTMDGTGELRDEATWLRLEDVTTVTTLLDQALAGAGGTAVVSSSEPSVVERVVTRHETTWFSLAGWRWVLPGLVVGLAVALPLARRREPGPRLVLTEEAGPVRVTGLPG